MGEGGNIQQKIADFIIPYNGGFMISTRDFWAGGQLCGREKLNKQITANKNCVIDGIRNLGEIEELRKINGFILIAVDAPQKEEELPPPAEVPAEGAVEDEAVPAEAGAGAPAPETGTEVDKTAPKEEHK